jgi:glycine/D-amino acid oxidase-like deaminating enzyme
VNTLPARTDVAIIGGGYAGLATARALRRRGIAAVVLEREAMLGRYASGRGAGLGRQLAEDDGTTRLTIRGAELLRTELSAAWSPTGGILTFDDPAHAEAYLARARHHDVPVTVLDGDAARAQWPLLAHLPVVSALAIPSDGVIEARRLLELLAADAHVVLGAPVVAVEPGGAGARVVTPRGAVEARLVVDASGAWAGGLTGDPPLDARKRHLFVLEATAPSDAPYLWHLGQSELYVRTFGGGVLASSCDEESGPPCDPVPDEASEARLRARFGAVSPALGAAPVARVWACQRSFTPDRQMRLGRDPQRPWLVWAAGLGGHGATASAAVGEVVAASIA